MLSVWFQVWCEKTGDCNLSAGYGYEGYGPEYYYDDRERFYRYYRDSRYRRGYAEEMGQYGGPAGPQQQQYDSR